MDVRPIGRRSFLRGVAATGLGLLAGRSGIADPPPKERVLWALAADTHISASPDKVERGGKMSDRFEGVVKDILMSKPRPVGMIINGDVAHQIGRPEAYQTFLKLAEPIRRAKIDLYVTLGNHDDRANYLATVEARLRPTTAPAGGSDRGSATQPAPAAPVTGKHVSVIDSGPVRLILLDSLLTPQVLHGELGAEQLAWLARTLDARKDVPTLLFLHHNLGPGAGLQDTDALLEVIRPRRQVKAVFQGHNHVYAFAAEEGIHLVKVPAVGYAFGRNQPVGWVRAWFDAGGCELELRVVDGDRTLHGTKRTLRWR